MFQTGVLSSKSLHFRVGKFYPHRVCNTKIAKKSVKVRPIVSTCLDDTIKVGVIVNTVKSLGNFSIPKNIYCAKRTQHCAATIPKHQNVRHQKITASSGCNSSFKNSLDFDLRWRRPLWYLVYFPRGDWDGVFVCGVAPPQTLNQGGSWNTAAHHVLLALLLLNLQGEARAQDTLKPRSSQFVLNTEQTSSLSYNLLRYFSTVAEFFCWTVYVEKNSTLRVLKIVPSYY